MVIDSAAAGQALPLLEPSQSVIPPRFREFSAVKTRSWIAEGRRHRGRGHGDRAASQCDVPGGVGWFGPQSPRAYLGKDADALHPDFARGQGEGGAFAIRLVAGSNYLPGEVAPR